MNSFAGYRHLPHDDGLAARHYWNDEAAAYLAEHGAFLGTRDLVWCPEGLREEQAGLLGDVRGKYVLEVGCGAGQGTAWVHDHGGHGVGIDIAGAMLAHAPTLPRVLADARALPFAAAFFDCAFTAFGALSFVPDPHRIHAEVARVLRPGGRWIFSVPHPLMWSFPADAASGAALLAGRPYFDQTPYVETDANGMPIYAEYHHLLGDYVRALAAAGLHLVDLIEPRWQAGSTQRWDAWSAARGEILPQTVIMVAVKPGEPAA